MSAPILGCEGLTVTEGGIRLLGPVDLMLDGDGITVVMGPNGAGKSLFLSAIHGLLDRHEGRATWDGKAATATRAERGFVFQSTPVLRRSVAGNIGFPLKTRRLSRTEKAARVARALASARLAHVANRPAAALSGGERKRLDLARAMVGQPRVVLLDEPAANLDPASTAALEAALKEVAAAGVKVILSTHDTAQARRLADDILFFSAGALVEQAKAAAFFQAPASEAAQRFLEGRL